MGFDNYSVMQFGDTPFVTERAIYAVVATTRVRDDAILSQSRPSATLVGSVCVTIVGCGDCVVGLRTSVEAIGVRNHLLPFRNLGNFVYRTLYISEDTLKSVGPFYLVYMPGEAKCP